MKLRMTLLPLLVGLASLSSGMGPAKAAGTYTQDTKDLSGYPIKNANGGSGDASLQTIMAPPPFRTSVTSNESSTKSGLGEAYPDYEEGANVIITWQGTQPNPALTLTFTATASASFSAMSSYGYVVAGASTSACGLQAGESVTDGSDGLTHTDSPAPYPLPLGTSANVTFTMHSNSSGYGSIYSNGGHFTTGSSSSMSFSPMATAQ